MGAQLALESSPNFCIIKGDLENAYNEIMQASIIDALIRKGVFNDIVAYIHTTMKIEGYVGMGSGVNLITAPFRLAEGVPQGGPLSGHLFSVGTIQPFRKLNAALEADGGGLSAIIDDTSAIGAPQTAFPAMRQLAIDVKEECGLKF